MRMKLMDKKFGLKSGKGFTLVELLIAVGLSSIVIGAGFAMFVNSNRVYQSTGYASILQQTSRAAIDMMAGELVMAGFGQVPPSNADAADEHVFSAFSSLGGNSAPDSIRFRANLGPVVMTGFDATLAEFRRADQGAPLLSDDDIAERADFVPGRSVEVFDLGRNYLGSGTMPAFNTLQAGYIAIPDFVENPDPNDLSVVGIPMGALVMQKPLWITYQIMDVNGVPSLVRCAYESPDQNCQLADLNSSAWNASVYVIAPYADDLQFSYMVEEPDDYNVEINPAVFHPMVGESTFVMDDDTRKRIRGVKVELMVRSSDFDPTISEARCASGQAAKKFYLGDRQRTVSNDECRYARAKMSTVVYLPNMAGDPYDTESGS